MPPGFAEGAAERARRRWEDPSYREHMQQKMQEVQARSDHKERPGRGTWAHLTLVSPTGVKYTNVQSMAQFCREHALKFEGMTCLRKGQVKHYKGWTLFQ